MEKMEGLAYQTRRKIQNVKDCVEKKEDLKEIEKKYFNTVRKKQTFFKANAVYFTEDELEYLDYKIDKEEDKSVGTDELTQNIEAENETSKSVSKNKPTENTDKMDNSDTSKQVSTDKLTNNTDEITEEDKSVGTDELTQNIEAENETSKSVSKNKPTENTDKMDNSDTSKQVSTDKLTNNTDEITEEDKSVGTDELTTNNTVEIETSKQVGENQPIEISNIEAGKIVSSDLLNNYFSNKENIEILIKIIETYKNNHNAEFTIIGEGEINIPSEILTMKNDGTMSIKTNTEQYQKIRELAFKNNVGISNFMNFVIWEFLKRHS